MCAIAGALIHSIADDYLACLADFPTELEKARLEVP
jgi:hypothetical protein